MSFAPHLVAKVTHVLYSYSHNAFEYIELFSTMLKRLQAVLYYLYSAIYNQPLLKRASQRWQRGGNIP